jgi:hypothetical protein
VLLDLLVKGRDPVHRACWVAKLGCVDHADMASGFALLQHLVGDDPDETRRFELVDIIRLWRFIY